MTKEECYNAPKYAGIYTFRNKINNKYYVGQAIKLRKRLLDHFNNYLSDRYSNLPIYRAFKKYGIENFELNILDTFTNALSFETKDKLDELEKFYIIKFNSYGITGYNATKGGDAGVLGLKHSEDTKKRISNYNKLKQEAQCSNIENWVKALNIEDRSIIIAISRKHLSNILNISNAVIRKCLTGKQKIASEKYIILNYLDSFKDIIYYKNMIGVSKEKLKTLVSNILDENPLITPTEASFKYKISRNQFTYYRKKLNRVPDYRTDTKISKQQFLDYSKNHSKKEIIEHFNITVKLYNKYIKKYYE